MIATGFGYHDPSDVALDERWAREAAGPEDDDEERTSISLGWLVHALLEHQGALRPAGDAPLGAARAARAARRCRRCRSAIASSRTSTSGWPADDDESSRTSRTTPKRRRHRRRASRHGRARRGGRAAAISCPPLALLAAAKATDRFAPSQESIQETADALESVLQDFGVRGEIINARPGPVVTLYELEPAPGIKSSRVIGLADDIARSMSALSARVAVVSGRNAIGIELPNDKREKVYLRELLDADDYQRQRRPSCRSASARPSAASR